MSENQFDRIKVLLTGQTEERKPNYWFRSVWRRSRHTRSWQSIVALNDIRPIRDSSELYRARWSDKMEDEKSSVSSFSTRTTTNVLPCSVKSKLYIKTKQFFDVRNLLLVSA